MKLITVSFLIVNKGIEDKKEDGEEVVPTIDLEEVDNEVKEDEKRDTEEDEEFEGQEEEEDMEVHCFIFLKRSGSVVECLPLDRGFEPRRHHCVVSLSKNIIPSLVLVQLRKTLPFITERLLMGLKESNPTNKHCFVCFDTLC